MSKAYYELLKHPNWQKKRLEIFKLRKFKCQMCKSEDKSLHVHHRVYIKDRLPWQYDNNNFIVLCDSCHEREHTSWNYFLTDLEYHDNIDIIRILDCLSQLDAKTLDAIRSLMYDDEDCDNKIYKAVSKILKENN